MKRGRHKFKERETLFGVNPVVEAINSGRRKIYAVAIKSGHIDSKQIQRLESLVAKKNIPMERVGIDEIARMAGAEGHQGVAAIVSSFAYTNLDKLLEQVAKKTRTSRPSIAILDGVTDPRNLGAIIRSASSFGFDGVIIPQDRAASYTPVAAKASAGAGESMNICMVTNIAETVRKLRAREFTCVALDGEAETELDNAPSGPVAVVLGAEGTGIRRLVLQRCDFAARIPMAGGIGSLNVAQAAAIAFYVVYKSG